MIMKKKIIALLLGLFVLPAGAFGCGRKAEEENGPQAKPQATQAENLPSADPTEAVPTYQGSLTLSMRQPKTLNPVLNTDASVDKILQILFEPLFYMDDHFQVVPHLAKSYELSSDGLSAAIVLRDDILWSDGRPVTAGDLVFTINAIKNAPEDSVYYGMADNMAKVTLTGNHTVKVDFAQHFSGMAYQFVFPLIPEHYYKDQTDPASERNMTPLGNGPFTYVSYKSGEDLILAASQESSRKPYIQEIVVKITPDQETDLYAFDQNILDALSANLAAWGKYRSTKEANIGEYNTTYYDFVGFNFHHALLQDKRVRQAVAYCTDISEYANNIYLNHAVKANSPVNPESWLHGEGITTYGLDTDKAAELLSQLNEPVQLRILVNTENEERVKIAEDIKENLEKAGAAITLEQVDFSVFNQRINAQDFDIFVGGFNLAPFPDLTFAFHSEGNYFSYANPEMDALLSEVFASVGEIPLKNAVANLERYIADEALCVSICFRRSACLTGTQVHGEIGALNGYIYRNIHQWYL